MWHLLALSLIFLNPVFIELAKTHSFCFLLLKRKTPAQNGSVGMSVNVIYIYHLHLHPFFFKRVSYFYTTISFALYPYAVETLHFTQNQSKLFWIRVWDGISIQFRTVLANVTHYCLCQNSLSGIPPLMKNYNVIVVMFFFLLIFMLKQTN